jgi:hypothetical protein
MVVPGRTGSGTLKPSGRFNAIRDLTLSLEAKWETALGGPGRSATVTGNPQGDQRVSGLTPMRC